MSVDDWADGAELQLSQAIERILQLHRVETDVIHGAMRRYCVECSGLAGRIIDASTCRTVAVLKPPS